MARGIARAPSQNAYRGALGRTQTSTVHVTGPHGDLVAVQVHTTIDAVSDPELADRLQSDDPQRAINAVRLDGATEPLRLAVPVLYHDPAAELLVLVLGDTLRHRELDERIRVYERLRDDAAPIPAYAKDLAVVYGAAGLRAYLEQRAQEALASREAKDLERRRAELAQRETEHERKSRELDSAKQELERSRRELEAAKSELERLRSEARNRVIAAAQKPTPTPAPAPAPAAPPPLQPNDDSQPGIQTAPISKTDIEQIADDDEILTTSQPAVEPAVTTARDVSFPEIVVEAGTAPHAQPPEHAAAIIPPGSDPLTTETTDLTIDVVTEPWLDKAAAQAASSFHLVGGAVRLVLTAGERIVRGLGGALDVRVLLHRTPHYPIVSFLVGPPPAFRAPSPTQLVVLTFDVASEHDRAVLAQLAKKCEVTIDVIARGKPMRRARIAAPLADNIAYILRAADDHLRGVTADGDASYVRGRDLVLGAGYDLLGLENAEASEFRDDKLAQLETAQHLRRALAIARKFARPSREDYLICTRGFPLPRWRELRRHVLESAVAWGLWMGPELAQVAVSEGLARSRRDLIVKLDAGFEHLRKHPTAFDIDNDAADDNKKALAEEAKALGVELKRPRNGALVTSAEHTAASGTIGGTPAHGSQIVTPIVELLKQLDDKKLRVKAALELCQRGEQSAARQVIASVQHMSRSEAVRVLGMAVKLGEAAKVPLLEGLASSKAFLRHGCALALALLRSEDGTQAVIDLLMTEPTEIWREVARAIGQVGPTALLPLAATYGRLAERGGPALAERAAWAMAHIAVRGGKGAVEQMAAGQSVVAPVAKHALELHSSAARDQVRVRPGADGSQTGRDVTVNRAFSRRFFEALEQGIPDAGQAGLTDLDASGPMEMLDESDLIEESEELDESDLIQP
jgi:hypothetical protein